MITANGGRAGKTGEKRKAKPFSNGALRRRAGKAGVGEARSTSLPVGFANRRADRE